MLTADWYEGCAQSARRWTVAFKLAAAGFGVAAVFALAALVTDHYAQHWGVALAWSIIGALYSWAHAIGCAERAVHYELEAEAAPARNEYKRMMNEHYKKMNREYGHHYEKVDEGWWSEDQALLAEYAGLVSRWKLGGDLYEGRAR